MSHFSLWSRLSTQFVVGVRAKCSSRPFCTTVSGRPTTPDELQEFRDRYKKYAVIRKGRVISFFGARMLVEDMPKRPSKSGRPPAVKQCVHKGKFNKYVCGDEVVWYPGATPESHGVVLEGLPRRNQINRTKKDFRGRGHPRVVAANIEQMVIVTAVYPPFKHMLVDRLLTTAAQSNIPAAIVFNKVDLKPEISTEISHESYTDLHPNASKQEQEVASTSDSSSDEGELGSSDYSEYECDEFEPTFEGHWAPDYDYYGKVEDALEEYERLGYPVFRTSAKTGEGITELKELLATRSPVLFSGQSGAGKSALLNQIIPGLNLRTRELGKIMQGKHTTTTLMAHTTPFGTQIIDSPGFQNFGPGVMQPRDVARCFPEIAEAGKLCKYPRCIHKLERPCAVKNAVGAQLIKEHRYQSYLRQIEMMENFKALGFAPNAREKRESDLRDRRKKFTAKRH